MATSTSTPLTEAVGRIKMRLKPGKVARIHKVQWHVISLLLIQNLDRFYMMVSKRTDRRAQSWPVEARLNDEWVNTDYIAKHVIYEEALTSVGVFQVGQILEQNFSPPWEVSADLTLIAVTKGTGTGCTIGCTVFYEQVEAGNRKLLKSPH